jgi:hypothetical protein
MPISLLKAVALRGYHWTSDRDNWQVTGMSIGYVPVAVSSRDLLGLGARPVPMMPTDGCRR